MNLFWKIFAAVFISFVAVVSMVSYVVTVKQIAAAEKHIVERYTTIGGFISREIAHDYLESRWPLERLKDLAGRPGFLFWWVVRGDGIIHLADQAAMMGTHAYHYFPQMQGKTGRDYLSLHRRENYGIFITPLQIGTEKWSFWLGFSLAEVMATKREIIVLDSVVSLAALLLLGIILYFLIRHFTAPFTDLTLDAAIIGSGDLTHRITHKSEDELGRLAAAFNQMADDLQEGERFLGSVFTSIQDGISILDNDYNIVRVNPAMERWYAQAMPLAGKKCYVAYHMRTEPCEICPARRTMETGAAARDVVIERKPNGEIIRYVDLFTFPLVGMSGSTIQGVVEYVRDITEQKQAEEALRQSEEKLRQSQKMEAVGRLAGGIAHDFNNLLTAIIGYSELLLMNLDEQSPGYHDVNEIQKAGHRAASLTRQLLAFSRKQVLQPQPLDLNQVVANMHNLLQRAIGENIELISVPEPELGTVRADPGQIEQVVLNLVLNARDAMPQGGRLTIRTANMHLDDTFVQRHPEVEPGPYVMIAVRNTGIGMDAEKQSRIFEPFYTTKELGRGTGLGLATVYGIVKQSGGYIFVDSEPGQGTTFKIFLPRVDLSAPQRGWVRSPAASLQGTETILVVEDEEVVRQVVKGMLQQHGFTVLEAADGREALLISRQHPRPIHLLLTDVLMPGMNGREVVDLLLPQRPDMKVIYMSGHTENAILHHDVLEQGILFLQKPFRHDDLAAKVRQALDQGQGNALAHPPACLSSP